MKRVILLGLCLFLVFGMASVFAAGGTQAGGRAYTFSLGSSYDVASPPVVAAIRFAEEVKAATNGAVTINVFPNSAIGTERELIIQLAADEIEFALVGMMPVDMYAPEYGFMSAPFFYRDMNHIRAVFESHLGDAMRRKFLENNINFIGVLWRGIRHTSSNRPIRTPDDVRGVRIRMTEMPSWVAVWRDGLGGTTIPIALGELYTALQTGVAEASEGPYEQLANFKLNEVQRYLVNTGHVMEYCGIYASERMLNRLPENYRNIVLEKARDFTDWGSRLAAEKAEDFRQTLLRGGMQEINVNVPDFTNRLLPVYERFFNEGTWTSNVREIQSFAR